MALTPDQVADFVTTTLPYLPKHKWVDLALEHQEYIANRFIESKNVVVQGGTSIQFRIKTRNTGTARNTGMFAQDITKVEDVMITATVPWAMQTGNYSYSIYEDLFQSDKETIIKEMVIRDHDAMSDMAELNEENLWSAPSSTTDTRPMGIPFWLQKETVASTGAWGGGNPTTHAAGCAGVSSTDYPRWKNWTFTYAQVTLDDLIKKIKKSLWSTNFQAPVPHPEYGFGKSDYQIYTTYRVQEPLERLAETRNDNLGQDLARYIGTVTIGGTPVKAVPYLEANDTSDPIYGLNWKSFRPFVKRGCQMRRSTPKQAPLQHDTLTVHIDNWMNYICTNRRTCFVGGK